MEESERKAYERGKAGDYRAPETYAARVAYEKGKSDREAEDREFAEKIKNAPSVTKATGDLLEIAIEQIKEMGVSNWRGYVGGVLIFLESLVLVAMLLSRLGFGILGMILGLFAGGFLFVLHKLPSVRRATLYAYPAAWVLTQVLAAGSSWGSKIVSLIICAAASYGIHYLFSLGFAAKKPEATVDLSGKSAE